MMSNFGQIGQWTVELAALKTFNGRNVVTTLVLSILNGSSLFLQLRRATIKAWKSLNFVKSPSPILELASLEHLKNLWIML